MAEPFKNHIDRSTVEAMAARIGGRWDRERFIESASAGLDSLELKDRTIHIADTLHAVLPDYPNALQRILQGFPEPLEHTDALTDGFHFWPLLTFIERHGLGAPDLSLPALKQLTSHFSAEFAIRPYFAADPHGVAERLRAWASDPNVHVRRLVSEGTRPRLPWGIRLHDRIAHPDRMLPHLEQLRDDPSEYVRRSVANHLNDIAKDHPDQVIALAQTWHDGTKPREKLVRHALRTQIKAGDARAYAVLGLAPFEGEVTTTASPDRIAVGGTISLQATLRSTTSQRVRLDYAMHYQKKNGTRTPKVFHWTERDLDAGERLEITKNHTEKKVTTRRLHPGLHGIELRVNGVPVTLHDFELEL